MVPAISHADGDAVAAGSDCGVRGVRKKPGMTGMLYGRYHGQILGLAVRSAADGGWKAKLREILAEFDNDCRDLSASCNRQLHDELATQIEQEVLRFADPNKQAILMIALKHFDLF